MRMFGVTACGHLTMEPTRSDRLEELLSENAVAILVGVLFVALLAACVVVGVFSYHFKAQPIEVDPAPWGQLGDYFGGILNPIFGFLSVFALLVALVIQSRELRLSREALKVSQDELKLSREEQAKAAEALAGQNKAIQRQSFEQTFFAWLGTYREMLGAIEQPSTDRSGAVTGSYKGLNALDIWNIQFLSEWKVVDQLAKQMGFRSWTELNRQQGTEGVSVEKCIDNLLAEGHGSALGQVCMECWEALYSSKQSRLDSLFRVLYRLLLWIDSQPPGQLNPSQKWLYVSIVRAQLSWIELAYLFYNGLTQRGEKFKLLAEKYALFDNLTFRANVLLATLKQYPPGVFKEYAETAYDSSTARTKLGIPPSLNDALALASSGG